MSCPPEGCSAEIFKGCGVDGVPVAVEVGFLGAGWDLGAVHDDAVLVDVVNGLQCLEWSVMVHCLLM